MRATERRSGADMLGDWDEPRRVVGFAYCRRCAGVGLVDTEGLCTGCLEDDRWAYVNRAFCELLHRARVIPPPPVRGMAVER
jgi:hypothetical protein